MEDATSKRFELGSALCSCRAILARGPADRALWQREARAAVQRLSDWLKEGQKGGVELGMKIPPSLAAELISFINSELRETYLWNDVTSIIALPAPASWRRRLQEFAESLGVQKARRPAISITEEDKTILETLAVEYPMAVTQSDLEMHTKIPRQKIGERLAWMESKKFVERPEGTKRKGHAITSAGLSAIGRS